MAFCVRRLLLHSHYLEWICWLDMHNTWETGYYCIASFSGASLSVSPKSQNGHLYNLKATSQHSKPMALNALLGKKDRRRWKTRRNSQARSCCSLQFPFLSSSLCFSCLSLPSLCQSASGTLASKHRLLSQWVFTSQWMVVLNANYTFYLTTVTTIVTKVFASYTANPELQKQHVKCESLSWQFSSRQQLMRTFRP